MRKIMMLGFVLCASLGCAQSVKGIDTTGQQRAAGDCRYYSEPKGLQPITLESPSAAVLNPDKAPKRAIVVRSGVCSGRDAIDVVELTPDGEPTRDPTGKPTAQKYKVKIVPPGDW